MNTPSPHNRQLILSGSPGSPIRELLFALQQESHACFPSVIQQVIAEQSPLPHAILPQTDLRRFAHLCLGQIWKTVERARALDKVVFHEGSLQDVIAYMQFAGLPVEPIFKQTFETCAYASPVFLLPPQRDNFKESAAFGYSFEEAKRFFTHLAQRYEQAGFRIVFIPSLPIELQVRHIAQEALR